MWECCSDRRRAWLAGLSSCSMCQTKDRDRERRSGHFLCFPHPCGHSHLHQPTNREAPSSDFCCSIQISSDVDFSSFKQSASWWKETQSVVSWCEAPQLIECFLLPLKAGGGARESQRQTLHPQQSREQGQAFYYSQLDQLATDQRIPLVQKNNNNNKCEASPK